eukprot:jgi/Chlat1/6442/Chrsp45S09066
MLGASSSLFLLSRSLPGLDRSRLAVPRDLVELRELREYVHGYCREYEGKVIAGFFSVYVLMQCLAIPGTIFLSILAGALFGVLKGVVIVVLTATCGASACYAMSRVSRHHSSLFSYMLFLRVTPLLPNTFINVASPIVGVPYRHFLTGTLVGLVPGAFLACKSLRELYDVRTVASLFLIGAAALAPRFASTWRRSAPTKSKAP